MLKWPLSGYFQIGSAMDVQPKFDFRRVLISLLLVLVATLITLSLRPLFDGKAPLFAFLVAVMVSAAYGGLMMGLLATSACLAMVLGFLKGDLVVVMAQSGVTLFTILGVASSIIMGKLHSANAALAAQRDKLETQSRELSISNEELRSFAYTIAHDIRGPLKSVSALTEILAERNHKTFDENSRECARLIVGGVRRVESLTAGLLDYAVTVGDRDDSGVTDCNAVVANVMQDLSSEIQASKATISFGKLPEVGVNPNHLFQLISNLLSNALKYRSTRPPEITISAREDGGMWLIAVEDNGEGFEMKHAEEIFGMLKRLHGAAHEGNGIGLALCRAIVQRYGGRIWAESEPGIGSRFTFTVPKLRISSASARTPSPIAPATSAVEPSVSR